MVIQLRRVEWLVATGDYTHGNKSTTYARELRTRGRGFESCRARQNSKTWQRKPGRFKMALRSKAVASVTMPGDGAKTVPFTLP